MEENSLTALSGILESHCFRQIADNHRSTDELLDEFRQKYQADGDMVDHMHNLLCNMYETMKSVAEDTIENVRRWQNPPPMIRERTDNMSEAEQERREHLERQLERVRVEMKKAEERRVKRIIGEMSREMEMVTNNRDFIDAAYSAECFLIGELERLGVMDP